MTRHLRRRVQKDRSGLQANMVTDWRASTPGADEPREPAQWGPSAHTGADRGINEQGHEPPLLAKRSPGGGDGPDRAG